MYQDGPREMIRLLIGLIQVILFSTYQYHAMYGLGSDYKRTHASFQVCLPSDIFMQAITSWFDD